MSYEVELEYIEKMVKNAIDFIYYYKCIAYKKRWVNEKIIRNHKICTKVIKKKYLRSKNWYYIKFSDKIHFEYSP